MVVPSSAGESIPVPELHLPQIIEWRVSVSKSVRESGLFSLAYSGSSGRYLLRQEASVAPQSEILQSTVYTSSARSDYQAFQAQYAGHLTSRLYALLSYTWAHSIDTGSQSSSVFLVYPGYSPGYSDQNDRGSSSFDVRHQLSASLSFQLPSVMNAGRLNWWFKGWNLSSTTQARTGFPFDITTVDRSLGLGFANSNRPNLVYGQPLWIENTAIPGGRELNPAAFQATSSAVSGTLGRNVLTGNGSFQIDTSLRRQFRLYRASSVEVGITAFNLLNNVSFSNPVSYLGSALFGRPTSVQSLMLGSGSPTTGLTPLFQSGGPRTVELSVKFSF